MLTLGYIDGKCYHIYHTWILWVMKFKRKIKIEDPASTRAAALNRNLTPDTPGSRRKFDEDDRTCWGVDLGALGHVLDLPGEQKPWCTTENDLQMMAVRYLYFHWKPKVDSTFFRRVQGIILTLGIGNRMFIVWISSTSNVFKLINFQNDELVVYQMKYHMSYSQTQISGHTSQTS